VEVEVGSAADYDLLLAMAAQGGAS
jgi:hypothetical protein